jgi:hypothetical protein
VGIEIPRPPILLLALKNNHQETNMKPSLESILHEAVNFEAEAFDDNQDINGADLVEWFAQWRRRARSIVRTSRPTSSVTEEGRSGSQLIGALHALQLTLARAEADLEVSQALDNGGIHITAGEFKVMVFKHPAREPSA